MMFRTWIWPTLRVPFWLVISTNLPERGWRFRRIDGSNRWKHVETFQLDGWNCTNPGGQPYGDDLWFGFWFLGLCVKIGYPQITQSDHHVLRWFLPLWGAARGAKCHDLQRPGWKTTRIFDIHMDLDVFLWSRDPVGVSRYFLCFFDKCFHQKIYRLPWITTDGSGDQDRPEEFMKRQFHMCWCYITFLISHPGIRDIQVSKPHQTKDCLNTIA